MIFSSLKEYEAMKPGLSRIRKFLKSEGNPQDSFKCVHIAGTNGKGSVAAFTAGILKESGYKTGLYTSPHLIDITERIKINGEDIQKETFKNISEKYLALAKRCRLTYFEYLTALAFMYFAEEKIDIAVIETGLGGRFDATNVLKKPLLCVITSIALDHGEILGNSLGKIAHEKSGIIKKGSDVVCGILPKSVLDVIKEKKIPFVFNKDFKACNIKRDKSNARQTFDYLGIEGAVKNVKISLLGDYQVLNASVALCCCELLNKKGFQINDSALKRGLLNTKWPARFDVRKVKFKDKDLNLIIDGSHNEQSVGVFIDTLKVYYKKKVCLVFAVMKEKEYKKIIKKIAPYAGSVYLVKLDNDRAVNVSCLEKEFLKYKKRKDVIAANSVSEVFDLMKPCETAAVLGSLYLAGEVLKNINK